MMTNWKMPILAGFFLSLLLLACNIPSPAEEGTSTPTFTPTPTLPHITDTPPPTPKIGGLVGATLTPIPTEQSLCPNFELELDFKQTGLSPGGLATELLIQGRVPFSADLTQDPPPLQGEGSIPVTGGGSGPGCTFEFSGSRDVIIGGEMVMGGQPQLYLEIETKTTTKVIGDNCGGGGGTQMEGPFEFVFPYEDGHTLEWSWAPGGGIQGNAKWILHILCSD